MARDENGTGRGTLDGLGRTGVTSNPWSKVGLTVTGRVRGDRGGSKGNPGSGGRHGTRPLRRVGRTYLMSRVGQLTPSRGRN